MERTYRRISLQKKMSVMFCGLLLVVISTAGIFLAGYYHSTFRRYFQKNFNMAITTNANGVQEIFRSIVNAVDVVNDNESAYITDETKNISTIAEMIVLTDPQETGFGLKGMVDDLKRNGATMDAMFSGASIHGLIIPEEYPIARYLGKWREGITGFHRNTDMERYSWYQEAIKRDGEACWFVEEEPVRRLFMAKRLNYQYYIRREGYEVRELGVMVVGSDFLELESRIDMSEMPGRALTAILGTDGQILYANREKGRLLSEESLRSILRQDMDGAAEYCEYEGTQYLVQKNQVAQELFMLTVIPVDDIDRMAFDMLGMLLLLLALALLAGMIFIGLMSRAITAPIVRLAGQMERGIVEPVEDAASGGDEIGTLYRGYNRMQEKIREMLQDVWDSAEKQKNVELQLLQAQINPHFVYNSLGTISCQALLNGQDVIAKQLNMLVQIMRYNTREPNGLVPLEKEMQIIRQYAEIQQMSNGGTVRFLYDVAPACESVLIPKLIIQPLVENSIIHGFDAVREDGQIRIGADMTETGELRIVVADNGRGGDMEAINRYIRGEGRTEGGHDSLGVKNVYDRIRRVYGAGGSLEYRRGADGWTKAIIRIWVKNGGAENDRCIWN